MSPLLMSFLVCVVVVTAEFEVDGDLILKQHQQVMHTILNTLLTQSSQREVSNFDLYNQELQNCFDYYEKMQNDDRIAYQDELMVCRNASDSSKEELSSQSTDKRNEMMERATKAFGRLNDCASLTDGLQFFNCFTKATNTGSQDLTNMSLVSSDMVGSLNIQYQQIDLEQKNCNASSRNSYLVVSSKTNQEMQNCLLGNLVPPSGSSVDPSTESTTVVSTQSTSAASTESSTVVGTESTNAASTESTAVVGTDSTTEGSDGPDSFHGSEAYPEEDIDDTHLPITQRLRWKIIKKMWGV